MTSQGSPYARFQRALSIGNPRIALAAAMEVKVVTLADALHLVLLLREDVLYPRAAGRWLGRLCLEAPGVTLGAAQFAAGALAEVPSPAAFTALADLCRQLGLFDAAVVVERIADGGGPPVPLRPS